MSAERPSNGVKIFRDESDIRNKIDDVNSIIKIHPSLIQPQDTQFFRDGETKIDQSGSLYVRVANKLYGFGPSVVIIPPNQMGGNTPTPSGSAPLQEQILEDYPVTAGNNVVTFNQQLPSTNYILLINIYDVVGGVVLFNKPTNKTKSGFTVYSTTDGLLTCLARMK
jgi:hypothetical protein